MTGTKVWKVAQSIYDQKSVSSTYIIKEINKFWSSNERKIKKYFEKLKELAQKESPNLELFLDSNIIKNSTDIDTLIGFFENDIVKTKMLYNA